MLPIFELPAHHANGTVVSQGDWSCEIHLLGEKPLVEAPLEIGQANRWRRRLDLEHLRATAMQVAKDEDERLRLEDEARAQANLPPGPKVDGDELPPPSPPPALPESLGEPARAAQDTDAPADAPPSTPESALREDLTPADVVAAGDSGQDLQAPPVEAPAAAPGNVFQRAFGGKKSRSK